MRRATLPIQVPQLVRHRNYTQTSGDFLSPAEVRAMNRFKIGDRVRVIGILGDFYKKIGVVVAVEPNANGIRELDLYVIEIQGMQMGDTKFADFQLAPAIG
jgi:hypothetical protein